MQRQCSNTILDNAASGGIECQLPAGQDSANALFILNRVSRLFKPFQPRPGPSVMEPGGCITHQGHRSTPSFLSHACLTLFSFPSVSKSFPSLPGPCQSQRLNRSSDEPQLSFEIWLSIKESRCLSASESQAQGMWDVMELSAPVQ